MGQIVNKYPIHKINEMKSYYASSLTTTPNGAIFRAKTSNAVITAYKSGKVLFQGTTPEKETVKWGEPTDNPIKQKVQKKTLTTSNFYPSPDLFTRNHIGSDEAGTGDYFGPITVAAVYVQKEQISLLKELGVKDSKNLTDDTIKRIAKDILALKVPYSLVILHNEKYNRLQKKGWSQGKMKAMLHHSAIQHVKNKMNTDAPLDGILIDQFCEPRVYINHLKSEEKNLPEKTYFMTKAESHSIAVAAGSIIARASFVNQMDKLSQKLGMEIPKGASSKVDRTIAKIIQKYGENTLNTCAKVHFANTHKARKYM